MSSFLPETPFNHHHRPGSLLPPRHTYSFPLLKADEIVKCLNELGIPITQEEIQSPDKYKDSCRKLLEDLTEICLGVNREEAAQPAFNGIKALMYPELHDESIPNINFFRSCSKMMEICEIPDFSIKDVMNPTASRLRRQLSGIINFAKFREERLILLSELSSTRETLFGQLNQLRERNDTLNNRLSLLREQTSEEASSIATLDKECKEIEHNIEALNKQQEDIKQNIENLKKSNASQKEQIVEKSQLYESLTEERRRLTSQVVSSPEKFRQQIMEVGQGLQTEQKDGKTAEKKVRELGAWLVNVEEAQVEVNCALEAIYDLRAEVERQKAVMAELDAQKMSSATQRVTFSEVDQNAQQLQRHCHRAEEKVQQLRKQAAQRGQETQTAIEDLHQQLIDAEAFRVQVGAGVERQESEAARLEKEMAAEAVAQEQELADISHAYKRLEQVVIAHLKNLQKVLQQQPPPQQQHELQFPPPTSPGDCFNVEKENSSLLFSVEEHGQVDFRLRDCQSKAVGGTPSGSTAEHPPVPLNVL